MGRASGPGTVPAADPGCMRGNTAEGPSKGEPQPEAEGAELDRGGSCSLSLAPGLSSSDEENVTRSPDNTQTVTGTQQFTIKSHQTPVFSKNARLG